MVGRQIARITIALVEIHKRDWRRGTAVIDFLVGNAVVDAVLVDRYIVVFVGVVRDEDTCRGRSRCGTDGCGGRGRYGRGGRFGGEVGGIERDDGGDGGDRASAACALGDDEAGDLGGVGGVAGYEISIVGIRVGVDGASGFGG